MSKRIGILVAGAALFLVVPLWWLTREPTYKGLTMGQALDSTSPQAQEALLAIGTNHLSLLVKRLVYDSSEVTSTRLLFQLARLTRSSLIWNMASRRTHVALEAHCVFDRLGRNADPAIPQLARLLKPGPSGNRPSGRAMSVLVDLGDQGIALLAPIATHTNAATRSQAIMLLLSHTESATARSALTNALRDPDPQVQEVAWRGITNHFR